MNNPLFTICCIAKNEANTLPKMFSSLTDYMARGGKIYILDTGSTDDTIKIAESFGPQVIVIPVGRKFITTINEVLAGEINKRFIVGNEEPIVQPGSALFDFAAARNYISSLAPTDMICSLDCDEAYTKFDIDAINEFISQGIEQIEYPFVFAHKENGEPAIKFIQSKFFNRKKVQWTGIVHEVLQPIDPGGINIKKVTEEIILLEHFQEQGKEHRGNYITGLAFDCFINQDKDRQSHYLARELFWTGRLKSAIAEFTRHIGMNKWPAERAQSMIYSGDCYGQLNQPLEQAAAYFQAFTTDSSRREALTKLSYFYLFYKNYRGCIAMAQAALSIPFNDYYANNHADYEHIPHEFIYLAAKELGEEKLSEEHLAQVRVYYPDYGKIKEIPVNTEVPTVSIIIPTLEREAGLQRCLDSIASLNYPADKLQVRVIRGDGTVPEKVKRGLATVSGDVICYAANDIEFTPDSLALAVKQLDKYSVVAFNTGDLLPDRGNICEHFIIKRDFIEKIGGEIFCTEFFHVGSDNYLHAQAEKLSAFTRCEEAIVHHYHFSRGGVMDEVYKKGWSRMEEDRKILENRLTKLKGEI